MSLVSLPDINNIHVNKDENILDINNGIMMQPVLECDDLADIRYTVRKPEQFKSDFALTATFLVNLGDIKLVHDKEQDKDMWWGFMFCKGKLNIHNHAKHDRPTYFS